MDNFGYINARLRGMRSRLVTAKLDEALGASSYQEFLRVLAETDMSASLGAATAQGAGLKELDRALSQNFFETAQKVVGMASGEAGREINLLFGRYDLLNLKALARGKHTERSREDIEASLLPAGAIKPALLAQMASAPDLASLAGMLSLTASTLAPAFRKAVAQLAQDGDLFSFEVALDRAYFEGTIAGASSETLQKYLGREIDATNILTAQKLRAQGRSSGIDGYFLKGGREFGLERFNQLAAGAGGLDGLSAFASLADSKVCGLLLAKKPINWPPATRSALA
jgi:V/A-type H+/Na+-transporting ATPase subunit C